MKNNVFLKKTSCQPVSCLRRVKKIKNDVFFEKDLVSTGIWPPAGQKSGSVIGLEVIIRLALIPNVCLIIPDE